MLASRHGSTGCRNGAVRTLHGEVWGAFHQKSKIGPILRSFSCMKAIFILFFCLSQQTNEPILPRLPTSLWRSCATHSGYKATLSTWDTSWGFHSDFSLFLISWQISPLDKPSVIIAELVFAPFPQKLPCFHSPWLCLAEPGSKPHFALEELEGGQGEMLGFDLTPAKSMQLFLLSSYSFNMHQGRVFHVGMMFATVLWCGEWT